MGLMYQTIADGVGQGRIGEIVVPVAWLELAGNDCRSSAVTVFQDLEKIAPFRVR